MEQVSDLMTESFMSVIECLLGLTVMIISMNFIESDPCNNLSDPRASFSLKPMTHKQLANHAAKQQTALHISNKQVNLSLVERLIC